MVHTSTARVAEAAPSRGPRASAPAVAPRVVLLAACAALALALGACSFNVSTGGDSIDHTKVEQKIEQFLPGSTKLKVTSVDCPSGIKEQKGRNFTCTAKLGGSRFTIRVTQTDSSGNVHLERVEAVIDPKKAAQLLESAGFTGVDCGTALIVIAPGKTFSCGATAPDRRTGTVPIKVTTRSGSVTVGEFVPS